MPTERRRGEGLTAIGTGSIFRGTFPGIPRRFDGTIAIHVSISATDTATDTITGSITIAVAIAVAVAVTITVASHLRHGSR